MKTITYHEMDQLIEIGQDLIGSQLQAVLFDEKVLQLKLYKNGVANWLVVSMKPGNPYFFLATERIFLIKNLKKPLGLFLKTHLADARLMAWSRNKELGRVMRLEFEHPDKASIEISFVTGRVNFTATIGSKNVSAYKPKEITQQTKPDEVPEARDLRTNAFFLKHWQQLFVARPKVDRSIEKDLKKKRSGLDKMIAALEKQKNSPWQQVGEWLKTQTEISEVPGKWQGYVDQSMTLAENIENCFIQAKKNQSKIAGTEARILQLQKEIEELASGKLKKAKGSPKAPASLLSQADVRGKTYRLSCGRLFVGRSGKENLQLLRKAKAWYMWLHIKDYPGAYGILEKPKGMAEPPLGDMQEAGKAVIRQSLPEGAEGVFDLIFTECRYVRPIKGAKAGQVTYSHEKVMSIRV